jgi:uncharacterized protein (DUF362 family)
MEKVLIRKAGYEYSTLKPTVFEMLESVGSLNIVPGSSVLIKPNLLAPAKPELAVTTHPLVVRAVVEAVYASSCPSASPPSLNPASVPVGCD